MRIRTILAAAATSAVVVLGMSFAIGQSSADAAAGTTVGGVLTSDTEWTTAGSPYIVTSPVQIPSGITLTIDPGVTVEGSGISSAPGNAGPSVFVLNGTLSAVGTADNPIHIDSGGANLIDPDGSGASSTATFQHTVLTDGRSIVAASGYEQYASLNLTDSVVSGMTSYSYLWYNNSDVIKGNIFYHSAGFSIGQNGTGPYVVDNNRFETASTNGYWVQSWNGLVDVNNNSFDAPGTPSVQLEPGYSRAAMDATSNDWGTTDTSVIASMIYDANDDITCAGVIPYEPILDGPDPATPNGIFVNTAAPAITGTAQVGSTLTASTGTWGPTEGTTFTYQWLGNGHPITAATGAMYTPTPDVVGEQITVTVTASKPNYNNATATSAPTNPVSTYAAPVTGLKVTPAYTSLTATWNPSSGATKYQVTVTQHHGSVTVGSATVTGTSARIGNLTPKNTYAVKVLAQPAAPGQKATVVYSTTK